MQNIQRRSSFEKDPSTTDIDRMEPASTFSGCMKNSKIGRIIPILNAFSRALNMMTTRTIKENLLYGPNVEISDRMFVIIIGSIFDL
jgi:hypothetical protein